MELARLLPHLSLKSIQRGIERKGYGGNEYSNGYDAIGAYDDTWAAGFAANFASLIEPSAVSDHQVQYESKAAGKKVDFAVFSQEILTCGKQTDFYVGQFHVIADGETVTIKDTTSYSPYPYKYHGTMAELKKELAYSIYSIYTSAQKKSAIPGIKALNQEIDQIKKNQVEESAKPVHRTEFEFNPGGRLQPNFLDMSSMAVLQHQFDHLNAEFANKNPAVKRRPTEEAVLKNSVFENAISEELMKEGKYASGKLITYVAKDHIEKVWRKCQKLVQAGHFTNIKVYFADATDDIHTVRPKTYRTTEWYPVVFYIHDFYQEGAVEQARNLLVTQGIIDATDETTFQDGSTLQEWTYPAFPSRLSSAPGSVQHINKNDNSEIKIADSASDGQVRLTTSNDEALYETKEKLSDYGQISDTAPVSSTSNLTGISASDETDSSEIKTGNSISSRFSGSVNNRGTIAQVRPITLDDETSFQALDDEDGFIRFFHERKSSLNFQNNIKYQDYFTSTSENFDELRKNKVEHFSEAAKALEFSWNDCNAITDKIYLGLFTSSGELIGAIAFTHNDLAISTFDIKLRKRFQKQGWAKVCIEFVTKNLMELSPATLITVEVDLKNIPSLKLFNSLSFVPYGLNQSNSGGKMLLLSFSSALTYDIYSERAKSLQTPQIASYYQSWTENNLHMSKKVVASQEKFAAILTDGVEDSVKMSNLEQLFLEPSSHPSK